MTTEQTITTVVDGVGGTIHFVPTDDVVGEGPGIEFAITLTEPPQTHLNFAMSIAAMRQLRDGLTAALDEMTDDLLGVEVRR